MIGIIGAMEMEVAGLVQRLTDVKIEKAGKLTFYRGKFKSDGAKKMQEVVAVRCGIGKVFAAAAASVMLSRFKNIKLVINLGVAGGLADGMRQGDFAVGVKAIQHDYDLTVDESMVKGQIAGYETRDFNACGAAIEKMCAVLKRLNFTHQTGIIVSGDQFIADADKVARLKKEFAAIACDMETAAIAHVCDIFYVPFLGVRSISDNADGTAVLDFNEFCFKAAQRSIAAVAEFLKD